MGDANARQSRPMFESLPSDTFAQRGAGPAKHSSIAHGPKRRRILVIDDVRSIRELLRLHLSNAGYEVILAEDAVVAGRIVLANPPDLIITDVAMPYMDGMEFVAAMRADRTVPFIPVIFLTSQEDVEGHAQRLRAAAWLTKPVNAAKLLQAVSLFV